MPQAVYSDTQTAQYASLVNTLTTVKKDATPKATFDSVEDARKAKEKASNAIAEELQGMINQGHNKIPEPLSVILDEVVSGSDDKKDKANQVRIINAVLDGVDAYHRANGHEPYADMIQWAVLQGHSTTHEAQKQGAPRFALTLDDASANSNAHNAWSMQPNRAVIAINSALAEAIPFATYLPTDIGSNQSKLIIVSHVAGSDHGAYRTKDIMDGNSIGRPYINSARIVPAAADGSFLVTALLDKETGLAVTNAPRVNLLRGRTQVYVNGLFAGRETNRTGLSENSTLGGEIALKGQVYTLSGFIKMTGANRGEGQVTFTPALPSGSNVTVKAFIDYESQPELTPLFLVDSKDYTLYANSRRAMTSATIDARTQYSNESGIDIVSEAMMSLRTQMAMERHYEALAHCEAVAENNTWQFDYNNAAQSNQKTRADIWQDFSPVKRQMDQRMADLTMSHSSTHMYVGSKMAGQLDGLPGFIPSGVAPRPGIYRLGRWLDADVYYHPKAKETSNSSRILCIGRDMQVARNPVVLGDAVAPIPISISVKQDLRTEAAYYMRDYTEINPHPESAMGCAYIDVINMPS